MKIIVISVYAEIDDKPIWINIDHNGAVLAKAQYDSIDLQFIGELVDRIHTDSNTKK